MVKLSAVEKSSANIVCKCYYRDMAKKQQKARFKQMLQDNRAVMGLQRKAHFESGGDLTSWRGRAGVISDRKKEKSKRACRGRAKWD